MTALSTAVITDATELHGIAAAWWRLWEQCPSATPFQSPAWLLPWWQSFAPGELRVVVVHRSNRLVGLAPLYLELGPHGRRLLPIGISVSDYLDILISPEESVDAADALCAQLNQMSDWDSCELCELFPDASGLALPCPRRCETTLARSESCPVLVLPSDPELLARTIPSGQRRDVRQARHRMARHDGVHIGRADSASAGDMVAALRRLHGARWQRRGEPGVLVDPRVVRFHQESARRLAARGIAHFHHITVSKEIVAVHYGFTDRRRWFAYLGGFDPAYQFESPGTILIDQAIQEASAAGLREFHFLRGREPYKYRWGAADRWNHRRILKRVDAHVGCA